MNIASVHEENKPFKCNICDAGFYKRPLWIDKLLRIQLLSSFLERIINEKDSVQYIKQITVYLNGLTKDKLIIVNFLDFTTYKNTYVEYYICTKC